MSDPQALRPHLGVVALLCLVLLGWPLGATASQLRVVSDTDELTRALKRVQPGDVIELLPGDYRLPRRVNLRTPGAPNAPIVVRAAVPGTAVLHTGHVTLFKVFGAHWEFRYLDFQGTSGANHALHIVQAADNVIVEGNRFQNFHAAIKGNGEGNPRRFPDHVQILRNVFINDGPRSTDWSVVAIDIVGGHRWIIAENLIADIANARRGRHGSPGFVKGGASEALFDRNLVICEWQHSGKPRIGLSLGGGGTSPGVLDRRFIGDCEGDCPETVNGRMTNNIIFNCPYEPGIYLNKAAGGLVANNTIFNAFGIQARFPETRIEVTDNLLTGTVWERDGAQVTGENNIATGFLDAASYIPGLEQRLTHRISDYHILYPRWISEGMVRTAQRMIRAIARWATPSFLGQRHRPFFRWFLAPDVGDLRLPHDGDPTFLRSGSELPRVAHDFCGQPRTGRADVGAIQYSAGTCDLTQELVRRHGSLFSSLRP